MTTVRRLLSWAMLVCCASSQNLDCNGWFGSPCIYKCRCGGGGCDSNGTCTSGGCQPGWFGPACQYTDLASNTQSTITDGDDSSCLTSSPPGNNVMIQLTRTSIFTWLRVRVRNPDFLHRLTLQFNNNSSLACLNLRNASVDSTTLDIHCDVGELVNSLTLSGEGVQYLCSVYISGGRNVALRQQTEQVSTYSEVYPPGSGIRKYFPSNQSVDGNTDGNFYRTNSCSCTNPNEAVPKWNVSFHDPKRVQRFTLYGRTDAATDRTLGFILQSFDAAGEMVFNYNDPNLYAQPMYPVPMPTNVTSAISLVNVIANNREKIIHMCELEVYGESDCDPGKYGRGCEYNCRCDRGGACFVSTGGCSSGCTAGFQGESCTLPCSPGTYGLRCASNCSVFCADNVSDERSCDHVTGTCLRGCKDGYLAPTCDTEPDVTDTIKNNDNGGDDNKAVIIGAVVGSILGAIVVAVVIFAAVVFTRRRKNAKSQRRNFSSTDYLEPVICPSPPIPHAKPAPSARTANGLKEGGKGTENGARPGVYYNTVSAAEGSTVVSLEELEDFMASKDKAFFKNQFNTIAANKTATMNVGLSAENKNKNRYKNICAYDHSRVNLIPNVAKKHGDYINASYIEGYKSDEKFIAAQGPTKVILEDFVRMLWEQQVEKVVMLTNLVEDGKEKCVSYWTEGGKLKVGDITIKLITTQVLADYTIRRLHLGKKSQPGQDLIHFHFTSWPDKVIANTAWALVDFEQRVASYQTSRPIVVHCSSGVDRTGTFIALSNITRQAEQTGHVDFFTAVQKLRQNRANMVPTLDQYIFLHRAAQVAMLCIGTTVTSKDIQSRIQSLNASGQTKLSAEFRSLCAVSNIKEEEWAFEENPYNVYENSQSEVNRRKNRYSSVLPKELYRAKLLCENSDLGDYINAVLVPSFSKQNQQVLTQLPLPETVADFWRLVTQYQVNLIVAVDVDQGITDLEIADYMSPRDAVTTSLFTIKTDTESACPGWIQQELTVTTETSITTPANLHFPPKTKHHVTHLTGITIMELRTTLDLIQHIRSLRHAAVGGTTLYMCRNGATYSGLACVLSLLLDRLDNDQCLTVPLVVGAIKAIRPEIIPTLDQYRLLYDMVAIYSENLGVYCNLGGSSA